VKLETTGLYLLNYDFYQEETIAIGFFVTLSNACAVLNFVVSPNYTNSLFLIVASLVIIFNSSACYLTSVNKMFRSHC